MVVYNIQYLSVEIIVLLRGRSLMKIEQSDHF